MGGNKGKGMHKREHNSLWKKVQEQEQLKGEKGEIELRELGRKEQLDAQKLEGREVRVRGGRAERERDAQERAQQSVKKVQEWEWLKRERWNRAEMLERTGAAWCRETWERRELEEEGWKQQERDAQESATVCERTSRAGAAQERKVK